MNLLLDGDCISYRAAFAAEKTKYLVTDSVSGNAVMGLYDDAKAAKEAAHLGCHIWSRKEVQPVENAITIADAMIRDIKDRYPEGKFKTYLTGVGNWRHQVATRQNYKGGRTQAPPTHLKAVRLHLQMNYGAEVSQGEEADDMIGREVYCNSTTPLVVSIDKDLKSLPCRFYDFVKREEILISKKEAITNFYMQVISGDPTDSIPGCTGYGPVKARKALEDCKSPGQMWERALSLYCWEYGDISGPLFALETARLVKIGLPKGTLWAPPTEL